VTLLKEVKGKQSKSLATRPIDFASPILRRMSKMRPLSRRNRKYHKACVI
jgi:hypothetical protein